MLEARLVSELQRLSREEKLYVVQILVNELAGEAVPDALKHTQYEVWSPYDSGAAAEALLQLLEQDREAPRG